MATSARDQIDTIDFTHGPTTLVRVLGGWGRVNGPGLYMLRSLLLGTCSAAVAGVIGAMVGGLVLGGGAIPFAVSASVGFSFMVMRWALTVMHESLASARLFPNLLLLHMRANFPVSEYNTWSTSTFLSRLDEPGLSGFKLRSRLIPAYLTASPALEAIHLQREEQIVADYVAHPDGVPLIDAKAST